MIFVTGANGQVGTAFRSLLPDATFFGRSQLDLRDVAAIGPAHEDVAEALGDGLESNEAAIGRPGRTAGRVEALADIHRLEEQRGDVSAEAVMAAPEDVGYRGDREPEPVLQLVWEPYGDLPQTVLVV